MAIRICSPKFQPLNFEDIVPARPKLQQNILLKISLKRLNHTPPLLIFTPTTSAYVLQMTTPTSYRLSINDLLHQVYSHRLPFIYLVQIISKASWAKTDVE